MRPGGWGVAAAVMIAAGVALAQSQTAPQPDTAAGRPAAPSGQATPDTAAGRAKAEAPSRAGAAAKRDQAKPASRESRFRVKKAVLGIRHRAIHEFYDEVTVKVGQEFTVGDTRYTGKVLRFVPDFGVDIETRQVFSKSNRLNNPAMQIATAENGVPHDTTWAFLNFPPHFSKRALLAFQVLRIEFDNHAPVTVKNLPKIDTTSTGGRKP